MDSNKNIVNSIPGLPWGTGLKIGSGLTSLIFGLVMVFLVLYLFATSEEQKNMWLTLMILMIFVGVIATVAIAVKRKSSKKSSKKTTTTHTKIVEKQVVVKHCVKCGEIIPEKAQYCEKCGEKQPSSRTKKLKKCGKCDKDIAQAADYCEFCGAKQ